MVKKKIPNCLDRKLSGTELPSVVLFMTSCFTAAFGVGGECGMYTYNKSRGTQNCENIVKCKVLDQQGCAYHLEIGCGNPIHTRTFWTSERISDFEPDADSDAHKEKNGERGWTINRLVCFAGTMTDPRYKKLLRFFSIIGCDFLSPRGYQLNVEKIAKKASFLARISKLAVSQRLYQIMGALYDAVIHIAGSFDCSWLTRGQKSRHGVVTAVCCETGDILDTEVMSSYCHKCAVNGSDADCTEEEDDLENRVNCDNCDINHTGSSGTMEVTGVRAIFDRSIGFLRCIFAFMIRDGDSKAYEKVKDSYGEQLPGGVQYRLDKNHSIKSIKKRLHSARNGRQIGGKSVKGRGKLTEKFVNQLCTYIAYTIRTTAENNGSILQLRTAIMAVYHHKSSSDDAPDHGYCPDGPDSWCTYQRWVAAGKTGIYEHKNVVPKKFMEALLPVFEFITTDSYLEHLLHNYSTSLNESFNSLIWQFCNKSTFKCRQSVQIAVDLATMIWNDGWKSSLVQLYSDLNLKMPRQAVVFSENQDKRREIQIQQRKAEVQQQKEQREAERLHRLEIENAKRNNSANEKKRKRAVEKSVQNKRSKAYEAGAYDCFP